MCWGQNSGAHAWVASALLTESSFQQQVYFSKLSENFKTWTLCLEYLKLKWLWTQLCSEARPADDASQRKQETIPGPPHADHFLLLSSQPRMIRPTVVPVLQKRSPRHLKMSPELSSQWSTRGQDSHPCLQDIEPRAHFCSGSSCCPLTVPVHVPPLRPYRDTFRSSLSGLSLFMRQELRQPPVSFLYALKLKKKCFFLANLPTRLFRGVPSG